MGNNKKRRPHKKKASQGASKTDGGEPSSAGDIEKNETPIEEVKVGEKSTESMPNLDKSVEEVSIVECKVEEVTAKEEEETEEINLVQKEDPSKVNHFLLELLI